MKKDRKPNQTDFKRLAFQDGYRWFLKILYELELISEEVLQKTWHNVIDLSWKRLPK